MENLEVRNRRGSDVIIITKKINDRAFFCELCFLVISEVTPIKYHQHDYPNMR